MDMAKSSELCDWLVHAEKLQMAGERYLVPAVMAFHHTCKAVRSLRRCVSQQRKGGSKI